MTAYSRQFKTIDEYISTFPEDVRSILNTLRQTVKENAPAAEEAIKYQMPTYVLHGNLVHFAAFKNHIGFYPTPTPPRPAQRRSEKNWLLTKRPKVLSNFQSTNRFPGC